MKFLVFAWGILFFSSAAPATTLPRVPVEALFNNSDAVVIGNQGQVEAYPLARTRG